jgi:hypothetical protein
MRRVALLAVLLFASGCQLLLDASMLTSHTSRLDTVVFYRGPKVQLRVVRYREYDPLSNIGYSYVVECRSGRHWTELASALDNISPNAAAIAKEVARQFKTVGGGVVWLKDYAPPAVASDSCTFNEWQPWYVDVKYIDPAKPQAANLRPINPDAKPSFCADPKIDCRPWEFGGARRPRYTNFKLDPDGISFDVTSLAFKDGVAMRVETRDLGATWTYAPITRR